MSQENIGEEAYTHEQKILRSKNRQRLKSHLIHVNLDLHQIKGKDKVVEGSLHVSSKSKVEPKLQSMRKMQKMSMYEPESRKRTIDLVKRLQELMNLNYGKRQPFTSLSHKEAQKFGMENY